MAIFPRIVDVSHWQGRAIDLQAAANFGIWGVICKCTENLSYVDDTYAINRAKAKAAGLLWGAYHFIRPGNIIAQADFFLNHALPDADTLVALDHEDPGVSINDVKTWLAYVAQKTKRKPVLYDGFVIRAQLGNRVDPELGQYRLWLADYTAAPQPLPTWPVIWLLQYTGDGHGRTPHAVPGIGNNIDINSYGGTREQLAAEWAGTGVPATAPTPEQQPVPPAVLKKGAKGDAVKALQAALNAHPMPLNPDGDFGGETDVDLRRFQRRTGLLETGVADSATLAKLNG